MHFRSITHSILSLKKNAASQCLLLKSFASDLGKTWRSSIAETFFKEPIPLRKKAANVYLRRLFCVLIPNIFCQKSFKEENIQHRNGVFSFPDNDLDAQTSFVAEQKRWCL